MLCPKCENLPLKRRTISIKNLELDRCPECKGMWFDEGELCAVLGSKACKSFDISKYAAEMLNTDCPRCKVCLHEFCYPGTTVLVDGCRQCKGVWLDNREWSAISQARDERNKITCPKCHTRQQRSDSCCNCGIVIAKYSARSTEKVQSKKAKATRSKHLGTMGESSYADDIPGLKGSLLRMIDTAIKNLTGNLFW